MRKFVAGILASFFCACSAAPSNNMGDDDNNQGNDAGGGDSTATTDSPQSGNDSSQTNDTGGPPPLPSSDVQIIVEPNGNNGQEVVTAINAAKVSVHMTMYILSSSAVIDALINRHKAGVDVKVVLDSSSTTDNTSVYNQLKSAGVGVTWSSTMFQYTHEKCVIVDGSTAWIMTMNLDVSSSEDNREYLAIDTSAADIAEAEAVFAGDYAGSPPTSVTGPLVVAPLNAVSSITGWIGTAKNTIDIEDEEFSDYNTVNALKAALGRGVKVRIVLSNDTQTSTGQMAVSEVKAAGGTFVEVTTPYIHAKALVIDDILAFVGSENLTTGSLAYNRELGVWFSSTAQVSQVETTIAADYAKGTPL
jgi:cardiolipin synthase A/B